MRVTFKIEGKKYEIRAITIKDNYEIQKELAINQLPGFVIVSKLSGCPEDELRKLSVDQWNSLWEATEKFLVRENTLPEFPDKIVEVNGKSYGLIDFDNMTIGEFADLDIILNSPDSDNRLHECMAVIYREIKENEGEKYSINEYSVEGYKDRCMAFLDFPFKQARKAIGFFLLIGIQSTKDILISLKKEKKIIENPSVLELIENTENHLQELGTEVSSRYAVIIPSNSKKLQNSELRRHLTFSSIWRGKEGEKKNKMTKLIIKE